MTGETAVKAFQNVTPSLETQLILSKIESLTASFEETKKNMEKILDDHEKRLRVQAEKDAAQGGEISRLTTQISTLSEKMSGIEKRLDAQEARKQDFWQQFIMQMIQLLIPAGSAGGVVYLLLVLSGNLP